MTAAEKIEAVGFDNVVLLENHSYDGALVGVNTDGRAVYDFDKMVDWLIQQTGCDLEEATEWICYNTLRALPYWGAKAPVVLLPLNTERSE